MLVIHPDECIDCGVCEPECPIDAIVPDDDSNGLKFLELNRDYAEKWPNLTKKIDALPEAEEFKDQDNKIELFSEAPGEGD